MRWILAGLLLSGTVAAAQNPTLQGHPDDYVRADIEYGSRLYAQHCFGCHGARTTVTCKRLLNAATGAGPISTRRFSTTRPVCSLWSDTAE